jgi:hypothetical protein
MASRDHRRGTRSRQAIRPRRQRTPPRPTYQREQGSAQRRACPADLSWRYTDLPPYPGDLEITMTEVTGDLEILGRS